MINISLSKGSPAISLINNEKKEKKETNSKEITKAIFTNPINCRPSNVRDAVNKTCQQCKIDP